MSRASMIAVLLWLLALVLAGWIVSRLPLAAIAQNISMLSWWQWLAWSGLNLLIIVMFTQRWRILIRMLGLHVGFAQLLMIRQAGQTVSFLTPGPQFGGEPLQIFWLWRHCQVSLHTALLAVGLDRFYELWINLAVLLLGVLVLLSAPVLEFSNGQHIIAILILLLLTLSALGWIMVRQPARLSRWLQALARHWQHHPRLSQVDTHWQALGSDLRQVARVHRPALGMALLWSVAAWVTLAGELWLLLGFFDLALDFSAFVLILVAMRLAFLLPLPGAIGTLEAALFWAFQSLGLPLAAAVGVLALMRLRDAVLLGAGLLCLRTLSIRTSGLS
ncbi:MAG: lysylphosphatidylglycerol synthase transmembrane domain-containing protein [Pseudomonadales bacterium]|nr:lysylphosphatidylglycerol synthase transmembrane domain-containing protein [Pseudomonadales bacterium]